MVGTPAEIYSYGTLYCVVMVTDLFVPLVNLTVFLPVFYNLQLSTLYQVGYEDYESNFKNTYWIDKQLKL